VAPQRAAAASRSNRQRDWWPSAGFSLPLTVILKTKSHSLSCMAGSRLAWASLQPAARGWRQGPPNLAHGCQRPHDWRRSAAANKDSREPGWCGQHDLVCDGMGPTERKLECTAEGSADSAHFGAHNSAAGTEVQAGEEEADQSSKPRACSAAWVGVSSPTDKLKRWSGGMRPSSQRSPARLLVLLTSAAMCGRVARCTQRTRSVGS
jgi:hypothetical protein